MAGSVKSCEIIAWPDLGCEAVRRLEVVDMPLTVLLDAHGGDLYQSGPQAYLQSLTDTEPNMTRLPALTKSVIPAKIQRYFERIWRNWQTRWF